ncbi:MAG: ribbon-helix-helix protein, CopG family [Pseudomonadota bacterium]
MAPKSAKKEFRTTVILTEAQFRRVRELAAASDASIAWVLRQAVDRYLAANEPDGRGARVARRSKAGRTAK